LSAVIKYMTIALTLSAALALLACDDSKAKAKTEPKAVSGCAKLHDAVYYAERLQITPAEAAESVKIEVMSYADGGYVVERLPPHAKVHIVEANPKTGRYRIDSPVEGWILPDDLGPRKPSEKNCAEE
jgi:hypothetical protein